MGILFLVIFQISPLKIAAKLGSSTNNVVIIPLRQD